MPCYDERGAHEQRLYDEKFETIARERTKDELVLKIIELQNVMKNVLHRNDDLAKIACELGRIIYESDYVFEQELSFMATAFLVKHQKLDAERGFPWKVKVIT